MWYPFPYSKDSEAHSNTSDNGEKNPNKLNIYKVLARVVVCPAIAAPTYSALFTRPTLPSSAPGYPLP
jgi:hypothetical protein